MVRFWFLLKDGYENFVNFAKCNPSPCLPSITTESSGQSQWSYLVFSKETSSQFSSFHWCEDIFQNSKVRQNSMTEVF